MFKYYTKAELIVIRNNIQMIYTGLTIFTLFTTIGMTSMFVTHALGVEDHEGHIGHGDAGTLPPLKQLQQGVAVTDILCGYEKILMNSTNGRVACVYQDTAERLVLHGWEVLPQSKQSLEEDVPESGIGILDQELSGVVETAVEIEIPQTSPVLEHLSANMSTAHVYEPIYYVADNKITLSGVEKKIPLSSGILLPATKEDVENIIMPRIASGIGDTLILPAANMSSYGYTMYETEMGNKFRIQSDEEYPEVIRKVQYYVYGNIGYAEYEEFFASFMENAGLPSTSIRYGSTGGAVYGNFNTIKFDSYIDFDYIKPAVLLTFSDGWVVDDVKLDWLSKSELQKRAFDFAIRHTDLFDEERGTFKLHDNVGDIRGLTLHAGVLTFAVDVGYYERIFEDGDRVTNDHSVRIEATAGEIMWYYTHFLKEDWIDRIDIPESAKVRNQ